jgi:hypothetical protein
MIIIIIIINIIIIITVCQLIAVKCSARFLDNDWAPGLITCLFADEL